MDNKSGVKGLSIGITSIAVIFVVICMTIFAVLSLSTASQEKRLADKYAESVKDYWLADAECTAIANEFGEIWEDGGASMREAVDALAQECGADVWEEDGALCVGYYVAIDDANSIFVTLRMGDTFAVTGWQQVYDGSWNMDESINVFQGW